MKCPTCEKYISPKAILLDGAKKIVCPSCGAASRVSGVFAFVMTPSVLFLAFPFSLLPVNAGLIALIVGGTAIFLYWMSFAILVRLERSNGSNDGSNGPGSN